MFSSIKNLIIAICITLLLGMVYYFTIGKRSDENIPQGGEMALSDSEIALRTQRILSDIKRVESYTLDVSLLEDPRFESLYNFGVKITDVNTGRSNPFAPIE